MIRAQKTSFVIMVFSMLLATLLGMYALDIADIFPEDLYMFVLISIIIISIVLFIVAIVIQFRLLISGKIKSRISSMFLTVMLFVTVIVSLYISWWSLFVVAMYLGIIQFN